LSLTFLAISFSVAISLLLSEKRARHLRTIASDEILAIFCHPNEMRQGQFAQDRTPTDSGIGSVGKIVKMCPHFLRRVTGRQQEGVQIQLIPIGLFFDS